MTQTAASAREPLTVRHLSLADLPRVLPIERRSFSAPWSLAMFGLEVSKPSGISLVALHGERLVGYLVCSRYADVWHVMNVAVDLDVRRRGIGRALLGALFERADRPGERYTLEVRPSNESAVAMYERCGFTAAGRRPGYYHDNREDALVMWREGAQVILALETSCDDTCAAVVTAGGVVRSNVIASQGLLHARYGGVVLEIASRRHLELVDAVTSDALEQAEIGLDEVERVAVTRGPGLIGALLVGVSSAKALAARGLALTPVDHLHGHVVASTLEPDPIEAPYLCLVASGGHTFLARVDDPSAYRVLGRTLDDAAGEAFDKGARLLGLGYPGGPAIDRLARDDDPAAFAFPRSLGGDGLDFSFSGVKTALLYRLRDLGEAELPACRADLAASYQRAIVDALVHRAEQALEREGLDRLAIGGGVAANSELRERLAERCAARGVALWTPEPALCTDNAAMIAAAARHLEPLPYPEYLALDAAARLDHGAAAAVAA